MEIINYMSVNNHKEKQNWSKYYNRIMDVCPYSGFAYRDGSLLHIQWSSWNKVLQNEQILKPMGLWGVVYENPPGSVEDLEQFVNKHNSRKTRHIEYFFSHPEHSPNGRATPVPVIIQQRLDILTRARAGEFNILNKLTEEGGSTDTTITCKRLEAGKVIGKGRKKQ